MDISFSSPLSFTSLFFSAICKASSHNHLPFAFLFLGDGVDHSILYNVTNLVRSSSGALSIRSNPLNLFVTSVV